MRPTFSEKKSQRRLCAALSLLCAKVLLFPVKGHSSGGSEAQNSRALELPGRHSMEVLKNLENEDFAKGFDFSNLGKKNKKFWEQFERHFRTQSEEMRKHFAKMQKKLQKKVQKETKSAEKEARREAQREARRAQREKGQILKAVETANKAVKTDAAEGPETKTVIYTDKAGNKVIEKSSHRSKKFHTKHGYGVASSTSTTINSVTPKGTALSINSGEGGLVILNGKVISGKPGAPGVSVAPTLPPLGGPVLPMGDFERFFGKMQRPHTQPDVLMNPFG